MSYPLEPSPEQMLAMGDESIRTAVAFLQGVTDAPASDYAHEHEVVALLREPAPEFGTSFEAALSTIVAAAHVGHETAGPGFLGFIPGGGLYASSLADLLADTFNRFVNLWQPAPGFAQIEATVVRWMQDLFGHPAEGRGVLTTGGSMANLGAIVTARQSILGESFLDGTLYTSQQAHASVRKAATIAGIPRANIRFVPTAADLRMDVAALGAMVAADRAAGLRPFCVVAAAGTTNTGTVDPIAAIGGFSRTQGLWFHVDAAYGGPFRLTERGRALFEGIDLADSITIDPHKCMFLPYGTGCLLVRDGPKLREAHYSHGDYLQDLAPEGEIPNFTEYSAELSRDFRGLRLWLPIKLHGMAAFRDALDEKLDLAEHLYEALAETPGFELPVKPDLTVIPFRYVPRGANGPRSDEEVDAFNRALLERINEPKRVFMTSTLLGGRFVIRPCIVSHRTHKDRIDEAIEIVRTAAAELDR
jgi:aromatic-L-amino-acid/L-tryptophan decarboxylase